ncbi:MAG TPA: HEAT repeat domain-containing protein [Methylomirabilota bacterium]|nr:HEAT repeat domain-containing protein [Methylomirabilota bacterium]
MSVSRIFCLAGLGLGLLAPLTQAQKGDKAGEAQVARIPKERIPPAPPLPPAEALRSFKIESGLRVELVAHEPMIEVPVVIQFDPAGRLWVLEMRGFMPNADGHGETNPVGRVSILEDADGDGDMDRRKVFLDGLVLPRAMLLVRDGLLLCEPPNLWYYPIQHDAPGQRVLVADDFAKDADPTLGPRMNPEHSGNSLLLAMDNWIYSLYHTFRYRFVAGKWTREPMPKRVQWGLAQDDFGRLFYTSNSDQLRGDMVPSHYGAALPPGAKVPGIGVQVARDQTVWPGRINPGVNRGYQPGTLRDDGRLAKFTAACGTGLYRGDALPDEFRGNAFVCEPSANLVRRNLLSESNGIVSARNACRDGEFLTSTDELFRPVNTCTGPDGALYIVDMYHGIIQHRFFLTTYLRQQAEDRGLDKVTTYGRIYRIVPEKGLPPQATRPRAVSSATPSLDLVRLLEHRNGWWRDTAQRLLVERGDASVVPALEKLAHAATDAVARLHALWTLEGMGQLEADTVRVALADPHPKVRAAAVRLAEAWLRPSGRGVSPPTGWRERLLSAIADPAAEMQIQLALTLGEMGPAPDVTAALATLAQKSPVPLAREAAAFSLARLEPAKTEPAGSAPRAEPLTAAEQARFAAGKEMYEVTCLACHQQHGLGQEGLAPPLAGSEWVSGPSERLVRIVLHGMRGPVRVKGQTFELDMPALGVLDDEQIAAVLTYIRREWGHTFSPVAPELVKKVRAETADREAGWTEAELLRVQ